MELTASDTMVSMADLLRKRTTIKKTRVTERGELLKYFAGKLDKKISYVAFRVARIPTPDLYFIKSSCDDYEHRGGIWGKAFNGSLKIKNNV